MSKVLYEKGGRIARITLNRPDIMNGIDDDLPRELAAAVARADAEKNIHVMIVTGAGKAFCAGYDLVHYAQGSGRNQAVQNMPWDPPVGLNFKARVEQVGWQQAVKERDEGSFGWTANKPVE